MNTATVQASGAERTQLTKEDLTAALGSSETSRRRVSVHDPSIVKKEGTNEYYVFGSHLAVAKTSAATSWTQTDMPLVYGQNTTFPARYANESAGDWADYYPHAIDPVVFYDESGKLWMVYGSWSGGIYMLELDENTGLRDYTVSYVDADVNNGITVLTTTKENLEKTSRQILTTAKR